MLPILCVCDWVDSTDRHFGQIQSLAENFLRSRSGWCLKAMPVTNLFAEVIANLPDEQFQLLLTAPGLRIERIISHGHASPTGFWYDQPHHEWIVLIQGAARLRFDDELVELLPGDFVNIPAHRRHRVEWTMPEEPTIWLAVHYGQGGPHESLAKEGP
jgi:cupin 2 domain-containing protein